MQRQAGPSGGQIIAATYIYDGSSSATGFEELSDWGSGSCRAYNVLSQSARLTLTHSYGVGTNIPYQFDSNFTASFFHYESGKNVNWGNVCATL